MFGPDIKKQVILQGEIVFIYPVDPKDVTFDEEGLEGRMVGHIATEDPKRLPCVLHLAMRLRGQVLGGAIAEMSQGPRGNTLSHWLELRRDPEP